MKKDQLYDFFDSVIDDELEKKIIQMILQGHEEKTIIKKLLKDKKMNSPNSTEVEQ